MTGGVVSRTVIVWRQVERLLQTSVASQVRVTANPMPDRTVVSVPRTRILTLVPSQRSDATGMSKVQAARQSTGRSGGHKSNGGVVSTTVIVCEQALLLEQESVACQVRVAVNA